jgi:hypothetical protein
MQCAELSGPPRCDPKPCRSIAKKARYRILATFPIYSKPFPVLATCVICSKPFPTECRCDGAALEAWLASKAQPTKIPEPARVAALAKKPCLAHVPHLAVLLNPSTINGTSPTAKLSRMPCISPDLAKIREVIAESTRSVNELRRVGGAAQNLHKVIAESRLAVDESRKNRGLSVQLRHEAEEIMKRSEAGVIGASPTKPGKLIRR